MIDRLIGLYLEFFVLVDLLGYLLGEDRVERDVEAATGSARVLGVLDERDVPAQLRRQSDHLAARTHRRDGLLVLLPSHRTAAAPTRSTATTNVGLAYFAD